MTTERKLRRVGPASDAQRRLRRGRLDWQRIDRQRNLAAFIDSGARDGVATFVISAQGGSAIVDRIDGEDARHALQGHGRVRS